MNYKKLKNRVKLYPCPFCKGTPTIRLDYAGGCWSVGCENDPIIKGVHCDENHNCKTWNDSLSLAIKQWNDSCSNSSTPPTFIKKYVLECDLTVDEYLKQRANHPYG